MNTSKGAFAFLLDLPEYQGLPLENKQKSYTVNDNNCQSDIKNVLDEIKIMNQEKDIFHKNNINFYKDKCQFL